MKSFQSFRLDAANHCLWRGEERVIITPKAFDVLRHLVENAGRLVTQNELLEALWPETYVNQEVLRKYILEIRKALGDQHKNPAFIETVTKRGYRFIAPVTDESATDLPDLLAPSATEEKARNETAPPERESSSNKGRTWKPAIIPALVLAVAVACVIGLVWLTRSRLHASSFKNTSIAVLPFTDMSPGKDQEYFADGLSEQLINDLAKVSGLKVVARSSAFQFKGKSEDLRTVGRELGVANILEGSVRKEGNRVRITASLIKADDGFQLWSETYDRDVDRIFEAQDDIARDVTSTLQIKLLRPARSAISARSPSANPEAYQAYLQGQYFVARGQDKEDLDKALFYADQAIKSDASFAPAWAQRSQVLQTMASVALIENMDGFRRARESATKAIALDPNLATGYLALGLIQINHDWDWDGANASLKKAGTLEPGNADVLCNRAYLARYLGHVDEAIDLFKQAIALDPLRANFHLALGYELFFAGRNEEALAELQRTEALNPQVSSLHLTRGKILMSQGHPQEALAEMEKETGEWEKFSGETLANHLLGDRKESDAALKNLIATHQNDCAYQIAEAYAYRGESNEAFHWLDRAVRQRDAGAPELKRSPLMISLRQDPRYAELLKEMHLAD
jgi:TolB-like protein/DNA-binding winged helix-turn-helix (wHTH) protein/tetratricopeptide (TPR) repeat protein